MWRQARRLAAMLGASGLLGAGGAAAALGSPSPAWPAGAVLDVEDATAHRFAARDDRGATLDGLKVIQIGALYAGVYHAPGGNSFETHVATSRDLMTWTRRATLDTDASQATIAAAGDGFLVAYEKAFTADVLPLTRLPAQLDVANGLTGRIRIRFRYYPSLERLLAGDHARQFTAPRTAALTAEGTPEIESLMLERGLRRSRIEVGLHHFADTNGDGFPDADRQGTGILTNFRHWRDADAPAVNQAFAALDQFHPGFSAAPTGNIGDRDTIELAGRRFALHEAQYRSGDFAAWRLFLRDVEKQAIRPVQVRTAGGSTAFGNPTVTGLDAPDGRRALFFSVFVFSEGAAPGESGSLLLYRTLAWP